jgi:hypothetical protein
MAGKIRAAANRTAAAVGAAASKAPKVLKDSKVIRTAVPAAAKRAPELASKAGKAASPTIRKAAASPAVQRVAKALPGVAPRLEQLTKKRRGPKVVKRLGYAAAALAAGAELTRRLRGDGQPSGSGSSRRTSRAKSSPRSSAKRSGPKKSAKRTTVKRPSSTKTAAKRSPARRTSAPKTKTSAKSKSKSSSAKRSSAAGAKRSTSGSTAA